MYGQCLIACQCSHESLNSHLAVQGDSFNITHAGLQFLRELSLVVQALYSIKIQASESSQVPLCQSLSCCKCNCSSCYCCVSRLALLCSLLASSAASRAAHSSSASRLFCLSCFFGQPVFFSLSDCSASLVTRATAICCNSHPWLLLLMLQPQQRLVRHHLPT